MNFKCVKCNSSKIEEVRSNVTVTSVILDIADAPPGEDYDTHFPGEGSVKIITYGDVDLDGGEIDRYQCGNCGEILRDDDGEIIT